MGETLVASIISSVVGVLIGGASAGILVWKPMRTDLAAVQADVQQMKGQLAGLVEWQQEWDRRNLDRLEELEREDRHRRHRGES